MTLLNTKSRLEIGRVNKLLSCVYIGEGRMTMPSTTTCNSSTLVLALDTFGEATETEMILIGKASKVGNIAAIITYKTHQCKRAITDHQSRGWFVE
jgi:hypothetical protein